MERLSIKDNNGPAEFLQWHCGPDLYCIKDAFSPATNRPEIGRKQWRNYDVARSRRIYAEDKSRPNTFRPFFAKWKKIYGMSVGSYFAGKSICRWPQWFSIFGKLWNILRTQEWIYLLGFSIFFFNSLIGAPRGTLFDVSYCVRGINFKWFLWFFIFIQLI